MNTTVKDILRVFAWGFGGLWVLSIIAFFVAAMKFQSWKYYGNFMGLDLVAGVGFFIITLILGILSTNDNKRKKNAKQKGEFKPKGNFSTAILILFILLLSSTTFLLGKSINKPKIIQPTPTPYIAPTPIPTPTKKPVVNSDPIVDCVSSYPNCNGESIRLKQSQCKNITCCGFNDGRWEVYPSVDKCKQAQQGSQPVQQVQKPTTPTNQLNFYCYDNTNKYSYYTSSGEQCNKNNLISSCKNLAKLSVWDPCAQKCNDTSSQNTQTCLWAYSGSNAAIEDNFSLYQECDKENMDEFSKCLDACGPSYQDAMNKCNY